jgi:hypothetical protein
MANPTAVALIQASTTPYSAMFSIVGAAGGATVITCTGAGGFATALDEGPLKRTILGANPAALADFNVDQARGNEIRIYEVVASLADGPVTRSGARTINWVSNANPSLAGLSCDLEAGSTITIEIRLNHSTQA